MSLKQLAKSRQHLLGVKVGLYEELGEGGTSSWESLCEFTYKGEMCSEEAAADVLDGLERVSMHV